MLRLRFVLSRSGSLRVMSTLPASSVPLLVSAAALRTWRETARKQGKTVGFVPTMGALHDGHMSLVRRSLVENDLTVLSIFVNPAQFAPHEDLATYPRTLPHDLEALSEQSLQIEGSEIRRPSAVFLPSVAEMYPSGINQDVAQQMGTFVEVKGYGDEMEGKSRPAFFRGVATVVTKLFNVVEPTNAYFGQKDIQQCLVLKRMCGDLLLSHPDPAHLKIVPTARDPADNLALSSRNAYLTPEQRQIAPVLYRALTAAQAAWEEGLCKSDCLERAFAIVQQVARSNDDVRMDYIQMNDSSTLQVLDDASRTAPEMNPVVLSGAIWVGKTRLIDNIVLGDIDAIRY